MAKQKVTFTHAVEVKDHNGEIEFMASVGDVKELPEASVERWLRRGKCVLGEIRANSAELTKAVDELESAQTRLAKAKQNPDDTKEFDLAEKYLAKKQAAYDAIAGK